MSAEDLLCEVVEIAATGRAVVAVVIDVPDVGDVILYKNAWTVWERLMSPSLLPQER